MMAASGNKARVEAAYLQAAQLDLQVQDDAGMRTGEADRWKHHQHPDSEGRRQKAEGGWKPHVDCKRTRSCRACTQIFIYCLPRTAMLKGLAHAHTASGSADSPISPLAQEQQHPAQDARDVELPQA